MPAAPNSREDPLAVVLAERDPVVRYDVLAAFQARLEQLVKRVAAERARAMAEMHAAGLSYAGIAEVVGKYTRSRIQQLVEGATTQRKPGRSEEKPEVGLQEQLIDFLRSYVRDWPREGPVRFGVPLPASKADQFTPEQIAEDLLSRAEFRAIKFGTWLTTPETRLVLTAVEVLAPPLISRDVQLLVAALKLAIKMERARRSKELVGKLLAGAGVAAVVWMASKG